MAAFGRPVVPLEKHSIAVVFFDFSKSLNLTQSCSPWISSDFHEASSLRGWASEVLRTNTRESGILRSDEAVLIVPMISGSEMISLAFEVFTWCLSSKDVYEGLVPVKTHPVAMIPRTMTG
jgi:hypothetical protein